MSMVAARVRGGRMGEEKKEKAGVRGRSGDIFNAIASKWLGYLTFAELQVLMRVTDQTLVRYGTEERALTERFLRTGEIRGERRLCALQLNRRNFYRARAAMASVWPNLISSQRGLDGRNYWAVNLEILLMGPEDAFEWAYRNGLFGDDQRMLDCSRTRFWKRYTAANKNDEPVSDED
jgi:hypothetical protein